MSKSDVVNFLAAKEAAPPAPAPAPVAAAAVAPERPAPAPRLRGGRIEQRVPMTRLRARIAERMVQAQATQALLTSFNEVDLHAVNELRARYKESFEKQHGVKLGFMSFFTKACIEALKRFPSVNASVEGHDIVYHEYFDVGVAVSTDRGLIVPILRDADQLGFADIEKSIGNFAARARAGSVTMEEADRRHFYHNQRRRVRLAPVDSHRECAAERYPGDAQDPGAPRSRRRSGGDPPDDVHRLDLRSSHHRWARGGAIPGDGKAMPRGSRADGARHMSAAETFDVIVIGAGPAGYPAAIRAAQNKLSVACVDEWKNRDGSFAFGGTCLNAGCIPSKALLESSELLVRAKQEFAAHGIKLGDIGLDLAQMQKRRAAIVKTMTGGINALFKANGVTGIQGHGRLLPGNAVRVTAPDGAERTLQAKHVVLASGSAPVRLGAAPHDGRFIVDSWDALEFDAVPARLGVIGAGVIGLELGSVWRRLGSEVTVLEALPEFLPMVDQSISKEAQRQFKKQGLDIKLGAKVSRAQVSGAAVEVTYADAGGEHTLQVDKLVVAVGRRPFTQDLLADGTGVVVDARGFIQVDEHCRTRPPMSGRSVTWCVVRCLRTRARRRASWSRT